MNCHRLLEAYYGVLEAGAVLLPLNIRLAAANWLHSERLRWSTVLFVEKAVSRAGGIVSQRDSAVKAIYQLDGTAQQASVALPQNYEELLAAAAAASRRHHGYDENAVAELFYTSGTSAESQRRNAHAPERLSARAARLPGLRHR